MTTGGLKRPSRADRARATRDAQNEIDQIDAACAKFREFVAGWVALHDGDPSAIGALDDFLADYFYARRCAAEDGEWDR